MSDSKLEAGDKCKYLYLGKWQKGIIHGVQTIEDENGFVKAMHYLVDTGNDASLEEVEVSLRDQEITKRAEKLVADGKYDHIDAALKEVFNHKDLPPKGKVEKVKVRQPEQVTLPQEFVKAI